MLTELRRLVALLPGNATLDSHRAAVVDDNALLTGTARIRNEIFGRLRDRCGLDPVVPVVRIHRAHREADAESQPTLALLCALAGNPTLSVTADHVPSSSPAEPVNGERLGKVSCTLLLSTHGEVITTLITVHVRGWRLLAERGQLSSRPLEAS